MELCFGSCCLFGCCGRVGSLGGSVRGVGCVNGVEWVRKGSIGSCEIWGEVWELFELWEVWELFEYIFLGGSVLDGRAKHLYLA